MDNGIWATWYNLDLDKRENHISWLHNDYLPKILTHEGIAWAAHYEVDENDYKDRRDKIPHTKEAIPQGTQYICLVAATSPHIYYRKNSPLFIENQTVDTKNRFAERQESRTAILIEEERVTGPDYNQVSPGGVPAKAIQMGSYNMTTVENEIEIGKWYAQIRLPFVSEIKGAVRARRWSQPLDGQNIQYYMNSHPMKIEGIILFVHLIHSVKKLLVKPYTPLARRVSVIEYGLPLNNNQKMQRK